MTKTHEEGAEKGKSERKNKRKVSFSDDILDIPARTVDFEFHGFQCYKIQPQIVSVPTRFVGFDCYISGDFKRAEKSLTEILACYKEITPGKYQRVKLYRLTDSNAFECSFVVGYFESAYLRKQCHLEISVCAK